MSFTNEEISEFKIEAVELLDQAEKSLLALDEGGNFKTEYDAIFRVFHSIKGASGMMEMTACQDHMHRLEELLVQQKTNSSLPKNLIEHFLKGVDVCRQLLEGRSVAFDHVLNDSPPKPAVKMQPKSKVMVIDDEVSIIQVLSEILTARGFEVAAFDNPRRALDHVMSFQPDVVLTDVMMPGLSGLDVLSEIHVMSPDLPVVFVSGHTDKNVLLQAIEKGVYAVLEKPFHMKDVIEICRNAIEKRRLHHLLNTSINLLIYQFSDLDDFLMTQGKDDVRNVIDREIKNLLEQRRRLKRIA